MHDMYAKRLWISAMLGIYGEMKEARNDMQLQIGN